MDSSDEDKAHLTQDGKNFYQERDSFGSPIWVDRASLNCYKVGARGAPRGSFVCHSYHVLRTENCRHMRGRCPATPWTGVHNHRNPEPQELRYLKVQYHARVFLARTGSMVGLTAKLAGLAERYQLRWPANVLYDSMKDLAATCARTRRIWPRNPVWYEDPEWLAYRRRMRAARRQDGADGEGVRVPEPAGEGVQAPEPAGEGAPAPELVGEGIQAPELVGEGAQVLEPAGDGVQAPEQVGEGAPAPEPAGEGAHTPEPAGDGARTPEPTGEGAQAPESVGEGNLTPELAGEDALSPGEGALAPVVAVILEDEQLDEGPDPMDQGPEVDAGGIPDIQDQVPVDNFDLGAWVEEGMPIPVFQEMDFFGMPTPPYQPEEIPGLLDLEAIDAFLADLDNQ